MTNVRSAAAKHSAGTSIPGLAGRVVVYGAGTIAEDTIGLLAAHGTEVVAVIDANPRRAQVGGIAVSRPDDERLRVHHQSVAVILAVFNPAVDIAALKRRLRATGWQHLIEFPAFHAMAPSLVGDHYWLTDRRSVQTAAHEIAAAAKLWADERSRALFQALVAYRSGAEIEVLPAPDPVSRQYFAPDLPSWQTPLRLVDCGAFEGDTILQVQALGLPVAAIAAFEPDLANFAKMIRQATPLAANGIEVLAWPCGVSGRTMQLRFSTGRNAASALAEDGDTVISCVALDEAIRGFRPNLIKMDIEGAEYDALLGARELIATCRPGLAICVYHRPDDLWRIPQLIHGWNLGYSLHLRSHAYSEFDTVLYAFPRDAFTPDSNPASDARS